MPYAPKAHCRECKTGYVSKGGLCRKCHNARYPAAYRALATRVVEEHVRAYGWWCPGWRDREAHKVSPGQLTADHVRPLLRGGTHVRSNLAVLCRSCNGAKQAFAPGHLGLALR